jgi:hypothetical protein
LLRGADQLWISELARRIRLVVEVVIGRSRARFSVADLLEHIPLGKSREVDRGELPGDELVQHVLRSVGVRVLGSAIGEAGPEVEDRKLAQLVRLRPSVLLGVGVLFEGAIVETITDLLFRDIALDLVLVVQIDTEPLLLALTDRPRLDRIRRLGRVLAIVEHPDLVGSMDPELDRGLAFLVLFTGSDDDIRIAEMEAVLVEKGGMETEEVVCPDLLDRGLLGVISRCDRVDLKSIKDGCDRGPRPVHPELAACAAQHPLKPS